MLYDSCSTFHGLSSSERLFNMRYVLAKLQLVKSDTFFGTQRIDDFTANDPNGICNVAADAVDTAASLRLTNADDCRERLYIMASVFSTASSACSAVTSTSLAVP